MEGATNPCLSAMKPVAESHGVQLFCQDSGMYSFFNSPYPMHRAHTGVDIYSGASFGEAVPSPVEGEVTLVRKVRAPRGRGFKASGYDVVTLVKPSSNPGVALKILHVDTFHAVGSRVRLGEELGTLLRSGYYGWNTSAHVHVEVRSPHDSLRARGGFEVTRAQPLTAEPQPGMGGFVEATQPEYTMIRLEGASSGLVGEVDGVAGVLDGGIPYYGWVGLHLDEPRLGEIKLMGVKIGEADSLHTGSCVGPCSGFSFTLENTPLLGLSLYLTPVPKPLVKAIPRTRRGLKVDVGDWVEMNLSSS
jgi:hypothetical protein